MPSMGYEFQSESLQVIRAEIEPLFALHKDEVGPYADWKLEPAWDYYALLEQQNRLVTHTVRRDTALVGYVLYTVGRNNHYASQKIASVDVLFLRPDCRRSGAALALLRWSQARLFADGVTCIQQRTKVRPSLYLGRLFARLGFQKADETWLIRADGVHVRHDDDQTPPPFIAPHPDRFNPGKESTPSNVYDDLFRCIVADQPKRQDAPDFHPHELPGD